MLTRSGPSCHEHNKYLLNQARLPAPILLKPHAAIVQYASSLLKTSLL
ncbi:hypothetical protein EHW99_0638 [Erwinia amylovora]|uniref:Uncharacterized protein n=3 Tax=Erwinia amylovora TaxID=552 RepID=A0A831A5W0_ERWAM|nr:hypothetical protein EaACW_2991 [Erwinia amylovora ACW56400]QJQ53345.1 hypothetical protein EHX00_0638 [Erwinia amylovora]CBA22758.1 hypothetical protein predicted by Glimmer/Critica [Erwinia amylovora CFBP1430]CBX81851.1 hypothetical protein predicted by Glimmer/Critica [Erwinia amylovora ATCC BAA-2158]CCO79833.1 hypothetical protein BN432_3054 [Erwinia amylovora Ea356]CCO83637.1 hypothetical protein BN433_3080 [Erwinia amylovora Ea266]CCO87395.1 hypothetical protein BN434_3025 [Erwinia a